MIEHIVAAFLNISWHIRSRREAPYVRAQIFTDYETPKGAAPNDRAQIHMYYGTPKGDYARR